MSEVTQRQIDSLIDKLTAVSVAFIELAATLTDNGMITQEQMLGKLDALAEQLAESERSDDSGAEWMRTLQQALRRRYEAGGRS
jgi:hypothetical protein